MTLSIAPALLAFLLTFAGIRDFLTFRIANWLSVVVALLFFPMAWWTGMPLGVIGWHVLAGVAMFAAGFALFAAGVFGGGDAKLMAAASIWFGFDHLLAFLVWTAFAGGFFAVAITGWNAVQTHVEIKGSDKVKNLINYKPDIPYGLAFAAGGMMALPGTWWMPGL